MGSVVFEINKGINKPMEFRGLKAQYIGYLALGMVALLLTFAVAHMAGVPTFISIPFVIVCGYVLFSWVYRYSRKFGEYGLMKEIAQRRVPTAIVCRTRNVFVGLSKNVKSDTSVSDNSYDGHSSNAIVPARSAGKRKSIRENTSHQ